jgi:hypothetical protein
MKGAHLMSLNKLATTSKKNTHESGPIDSVEKLKRAEELLKELDSLALLLNEVRSRSERILAAADAIGDAVFEELRSGRVSPVPINGHSKRGLSLGSKLGVYARSDGPSPA